MTTTITHSDYHFAFIIISRENVLHLDTIKVYCDAFMSRHYALSGIIVKYSQSHIRSNKKASL
ncbi:hypothetical protein [Klebsiella quasivariicola]|uniref:hypothetical protein n=1 Tax=Klebsiella quasivariicola TaxID=2026240 RepID=UPI0015F2A168|nr:hypothetical protein [Klebsiella quasivariicola]